MFDIGIAEIFIVLVVALFAIGPDRLPETARAIGRLVRKGKVILGDLRTAMDAALAEDDPPAKTSPPPKLERPDAPKKEGAKKP